MSKYRFLLVIAVALAGFAARALDCTPGALKSLIPNPETTTSLSLKGEIDASDMEFIASGMPALRTLDLSEVAIAKRRDSRTIYPEGTIPAMSFAGAPFTTVVFPAQEGLVIEDAAFTGAALTSVVIPANVKSVGTGAFAACKSLKSATLNPTTDFSTDVFNGCSALEEVDFGGTTRVPVSGFADCTALKSISGAQSVREIGNGAFTGDVALSYFPFSASLQSIGNDAFAHSGLEAADMERCTSLKVIGDRAFARAAQLARVVLPKSVTTLGTGVFAMDEALTELTMSTAVVNIPDYAFTSTPNVPSQSVIHDETETIGAYALKGHNATTDIYLPSSVTYLGDHAMEGMTALKEIDVTYHKEVPELGKEVWAGVNQNEVNLKVGEHMAAPFQNAAQWQDFIIKSPTVNIDEVAAPAQKVQARFEGYVLEIVSTGQEIAKVDIFTTAGKQLAALPGDGNRTEVNTQPWQENIYIVSVTLTDGTRATAKLLRII